jgi:hypothetical protein
MKIEALHVGMKVRHPNYGEGTVKSIGEHTADIQFADGPRTVEPDASGLQPAEAQATLSGLEIPLKHLIDQTVGSIMDRMGVEKPDAEVEQLGAKWHGGKLVLHPADSNLQTKELPLETFFHKIVMVRNNLRVLEQKINGNDKCV